MSSAEKPRRETVESMQSRLQLAIDEADIDLAHSILDEMRVLLQRKTALKQAQPTMAWAQELYERMIYSALTGGDEYDEGQRDPLTDETYGYSVDNTPGLAIIAIDPSDHQILIPTKVPGTVVHMSFTLDYEVSVISIDMAADKIGGDFTTGAAPSIRVAYQAWVAAQGAAAHAAHVRPADHRSYDSPRPCRPTDACPGCGCVPGDGRTEGCTDPEGCGFNS